MVFSINRNTIKSSLMKKCLVFHLENSVEVSILIATFGLWFYEWRCLIIQSDAECSNRITNIIIKVFVTPSKFIDTRSCSEYLFSFI